MTSKQLISVITIFLNAEKFIQEAIESVIAQTYGNWELLLVDDGSTDGSTKIALKYVEKYPGKIHYLEHEGHQNRGMSASRNLGIRNAKGDYITFLDSDDVWLPSKLEQQLTIMDSYPEAGLVCGRTQWWYSWTGNPKDSQRDFLQKFDLPLDTLIKPPTLLTLFLQDEWASLCDILVRRQIVEKVGGYEETFRGMYEDQVFHAKLCLKFPAFVSSECWYRYRQHSYACTSVSHKTGNTYVARYTFLKWLENYLSQQENENLEVREIVQKELWPYSHPLLFRLWVRTQNLMKLIKKLSKLLDPVQRWLPVRWPGQKPPVGRVCFGSLRRVHPISEHFGYDRGLPIDRYYIENFLTHHADDIRGRVLEIGDDSYTRQFGGDRVTTRDVLHVKEGNPIATFVGDLTCADHIPSETFDCFILTQTLDLVYDFRSALKTIYRILKPGGVVLATVPGISQKSTDEWADYWCWSFTTLSARRLFEEFFPADQVEVEAFGNVLAAIAFLEGLCVHDLTKSELDYRDHRYELLITIRAVKPEVK